MKNRSLASYLLVYIFGIGILFSFSSGAKYSDQLFPKFKIKPEYLGTWTANSSEVTVRTEPEKWHFEFTKGQADFSATINADKTVSGHIGQAKFEKAKLEKNWGLPPSHTGIIYIVKCGKIGKIFDSDPVEEKEVWFSISPIKEDGTIEVELRYGNFPMAGFIIKKL